jgi:chemotaxis signal transduction protein
MLASNTSVEAARAGDAGEGFAVVADTINGLAQEVVDATTEIEQSITAIRSTTGETVDGVVEVERVAEPVRVGELTTKPGDDPHLAGSMNFRRKTTIIIDLSVLIDRTDAAGTDWDRSRGRILVPEPETVGTEEAPDWLVSGIYELTEVTDEDLDTDSVGDSDPLNGLITDDEAFHVLAQSTGAHNLKTWTDPQPDSSRVRGD